MNNKINFPIDKDALKLKAVHCQVCGILVGYDLTIKQMHCVGCGQEQLSATIADGEPCEHVGCLNHVTHSCEGCGRIAGHKAV